MNKDLSEEFKEVFSPEKEGDSYITDKEADDYFKSASEKLSFPYGGLNLDYPYDEAEKPLLEDAKAIEEYCEKNESLEDVIKLLETPLY